MEYIAWITVTFVLAGATVFSAIGKFRRVPQVVASLHRVGVTDGQIPLLASLTLAGATGLMLGLTAVPYLASVAAAALAAYYFAAWIAHWRVGEKFPAPPIVLCALSIASLWLGLL